MASVIVKHFSVLHYKKKSAIGKDSSVLRYKKIGKR